MDIASSFTDSLILAKHAPECAPEFFLGNIFPYPEELLSSPLFYVLSGGIIKASFPFSFDIKSMDCYMLLYTMSGCGKLLTDNQSISLANDSLLLLDCRQRFRIDIAIEPWEYQVAFIAGEHISYYFDYLQRKNFVLMPAPPHSDVSLSMEKLLVQSSSASPTCTLMVSNLINTLLTNCITYKLAENDTTVPLPAYLVKMRELFLNNYQEHYSLDELEELFHISKYRLCREFGSAFGMPPLQYLNRRRIEIACHLLTTTDDKVHEIGSKVGIDNTNHFISLFKRFTELTPAEYKQRMNK